MIGLIRSYLYVCVLVIFPHLIPENARAQKIELTPVLGYFTASKLPRDQSYMRVGDGIEYGFSVNHKIGRIWRVELAFSSLNSDLSFISAHQYREKFTELNSRFISIGIMREYHHGQKLSSYLLPAFGLIYIHPLNGYYSNESLLHFSLAYGIKYSFTDILGLRFQSRLLMPVWTAGDYFTGKYSEKLASFSSAKIAFQGDFTLGVILIIPKK